jgi:ribosomal protein S18 acetylase RimI-like enzyme
MVRVVTYKPNFKNKFIQLNKEWLEKYFEVEQHYQDQFEQIEELIIEQDGEIFFIENNHEIIGTVAMQKIAESTYELTKMAITEKYKGLGYSNMLMEAAIEFGRSKKSKIVLWSNRSLVAAIELYKKFNFVEMPLQVAAYERANIYMELEFV